MAQRAEYITAKGGVVLFYEKKNHEKCVPLAVSPYTKCLETKNPAIGRGFIIQSGKESNSVTIISRITDSLKPVVEYTIFILWSIIKLCGTELYVSIL